MSKGNNVGRSRRVHERILAALPVRIVEGTGVTRNVSAGGVYFESATDVPLNGEIAFEIGLRSGLDSMVMLCRGVVVRREKRDGMDGIAVQITDSRLVAVQ
jgi:hypothetical protein